MRDIDFKEKLSYFYPRDNHGSNINADRDWRLVIVSFWFILLVAVLGSLYAIWQFKNSSRVESDFVKPLTLKKELFDKAIQNIDAKKERFNELLLNKVEAEDPSL